MVAIAVLLALSLPYDVVVPYSTCVSLASFVAQVMVALFELIPVALTLEIDGGAVSAPLSPPEPGRGILTMKTSLRSVRPQFDVNTAHLPSLLIVARGESQYSLNSDCRCASLLTLLLPSTAT
jgi:hypothetical protein